MKVAQKVDLYHDVVIGAGLYSNRARLQFHMDALFRGIDLGDKRVLDIGGGAGLHTFFAASRGASKVVCLEPEAAGSSSKAIDTFHKVNAKLDFTNVELRPITLQACDPEDETFDVVLLHNSINHLDEAACIDLLRDPESEAVYREIFSKIHALADKGAKLIISDCSRYNFFALCRIRNPYVPTIEWHKHHAPEVWANLLGEAGFVNPEIRWSSFNALRDWGRVFLGNKTASYFLTSHFRLTMDKPFDGT